MQSLRLFQKIIFALIITLMTAQIINRMNIKQQNLPWALL